MVDREARVFRSGGTGLLGYGASLAGTAGMHPVRGAADDDDVDDGVDAALRAAADASDDADGLSSSSAFGGRSSASARKYRYDRLNLSIDELGEHEPSDRPLVKTHKNISMFWQEKLSLLLFFLQMHALIWLQCYQYYPSEWREWWRWTLVFILDVHHLIKDSGGSNTASDSMAHTLFILALPLLSLLVYEVLTHSVYADRVAGSTSEDTSHWVSYLSFQRWALLWAEMLFVPLLLLWCRMWTCGSQNQLLYIQSTWTCWESGGHIVLFVIVSAVSLFFCTALPVLLYKRTKRILVFHAPQLHERYLQSRELEYILGVNNLYEYTYFFYMGSFKRFWAWNRLIQLIQKLLVTVLLMGLSSLNAGDHLTLQAVLILVVLSGPPVLNFVWRTYRCPSSNYLKAIFDGVLFFTAVMSVIEADIHGFVSSFIDPHTFSGMMLLVNCVGLGAAGLLCGYHALRARLAQLVAPHRGTVVDLYWPVVDADLWALHKAVPELLSTLNAGKKLLDDARGSAEEFYPRARLLEAIQSMRTLLYEAKARREGKSTTQGGRSLLDDRARQRQRASNRALTKAEEAELRRLLRLGEHKALALEWTLQDMVEDLALLYNTLAARAGAGAGGGAQKDSSSSSIASLAAATPVGQAVPGSRVERMQHALDGFADSLAAKQLDQALMHPYKRDYLARMLTIKAICTAGGNTNFVHAERPPWGQPVKPSPPAGGAPDTSSLLLLATFPASPVGLQSVQVRYDASRIQGHAQGAPADEMRFRIHAPLVQQQQQQQQQHNTFASDEEQPQLVQYHEEE